MLLYIQTKLFILFEKVNIMGCAGSAFMNSEKKRAKRLRLMSATEKGESVIKYLLQCYTIFSF